MRKSLRNENKNSKKLKRKERELIKLKEPFRKSRICLVGVLKRAQRRKGGLGLSKK